MIQQISISFVDGEEGTALKKLLDRLRSLSCFSLVPADSIPAFVRCPGAEVFVLPPGIRMVYQYLISEGRMAGSFDAIVVR